MSNTQEINAVSISSSWNSAADGEAVTPRQFSKDGFVEDLLAGLKAYTPAVNTIRIDIDQVTLRDADFQDFLSQAAAEGYQFIFNYVDPNFQERDDVADGYLETNEADLLGENDGVRIELDEQFIVKGDHIDALAIEEWGLASEEYDPLDYLVDGWQEIMDWLAQPENAAVADAIYGYEMINEPAAYPYSIAGGLMYHDDMAEVYDRVTGWGDAKILVGGMQYSARFDKLAEVADGQEVSTLDLFRETFGDQLVWSVHYYTGKDNDANVDSTKDLLLRDRISYIGDEDDIIVTEMNFDSDFNSDQMELFTTSTGEIPMWAGWTLLQPIFSGQTDKYYYARLAEEVENSGIGMTWWSPIDIDGNLLTVNGSGDNLIQEERDAIAFALNMWAGNDSVDADGNHGEDEKFTLSSEDEGEDLVASRIAFGYGGNDTIKGTNTEDYEGLNRYNRTRDFTGNSSDPDNDMTYYNDFMGDKIYGGTGSDKLFLLSGDDFGFGNDGKDKIRGDGGHDVLVGGNGNDTLAGGLGDDVLEGGNGHDQLMGGKGIDLLFGGKGEDTVRGGQGDDFIWDTAGADTIFGGAGNDRIEITEGGNDGQVMYGKEGADEFILANGSNGRIADFTSGEDIIDLTAWGTYDTDELDIVLQKNGDWLVSHGSASVIVTTDAPSLSSEHFSLLSVAAVSASSDNEEGLCC